MSFLSFIPRLIFGNKLDPLAPDTRQHVVLVAFLAWIGLGADGLSSSCYGPEEAFLALGEHTHLGLYLAMATAITVFIIALAYNQVISLFASGGGGYKAATKLIGPYAGLLSGAALLVDYVLTITISVAGGMDALFSLFPADYQPLKLLSEIALILLLMVLNLRGMKESIIALTPIFLGFFIAHALLIFLGIRAHGDLLETLVPSTWEQTTQLTQETSWIFVAALFLRAYSIGGGTYTGIEAVSNNVNMLAEPRVRTGQWTMFYMATSLAFTAGGIILLYLLWNVQPVAGQTLNAVTFQAIIEAMDWPQPHLILVVVLALEAGLLMVAANTGFLGGPAVMANMAADHWLPRQFRQLSRRLVTQYGVIIMGSAALIALVATGGVVKYLVVLYSINVFVTFSLTLFGLSRYWLAQRRFMSSWLQRFVLSALGLCVTGFMLLVLIVEKFTDGGWITLLVTSSVVAVCLLVRRHYDYAEQLVEQVDQRYALPLTWDDASPSLPMNPEHRTAVVLVDTHRGVGMHTLRWIEQRLQGHFQQMVFVAVGEVDKHSFDGAGAIKTLQAKVDNALRYFTSYAISRGYPATSVCAFGADPIGELIDLTLPVMKQYPNSICFSSLLVFDRESALTRLLHNQTATSLQSRLLVDGHQMIIVPIRLEELRAATKPVAMRVR